MEVSKKATLIGLGVGLFLVILELIFFFDTPILKIFSLSSFDLGYFVLGLIYLPLPTLIISLAIGMTIGHILKKRALKNDKMVSQPSNT